MVSHHSLIRAVRSELHRSEFATAISLQHAQLLVALCVRACLEFLDCFRTSVLLVRSCSHMYRLQSSTTKIKYLRPPGVAGVIGPQRSPWTSSRASAARYFAVFGNGSLLCFPARQLSYSSPPCLMWGSPRTIFSSRPSTSKLRWPNWACHSHGSSVCHATRHIGCSTFKSSRYSWFQDLFTLARRRCS